ncbi:hypothetical protein EJB05_34844, partial [Eragrostis curvula]
ESGKEDVEMRDQNAQVVFLPSCGRPFFHQATARLVLFNFWVSLLSNAAALHRPAPPLPSGAHPQPRSRAAAQGTRASARSPPPPPPPPSPLPPSIVPAPLLPAGAHRRQAKSCGDPGNPCLGRIYAVPASSAIPTAPSSVSAVHVEVVFHEALRLPPNSSRLLDAVYPGLLAAGAVHVELPLRLLLPELLRHASLTSYTFYEFAAATYDFKGKAQAPGEEHAVHGDNSVYRFMSLRPVLPVSKELMERGILLHCGGHMDARYVLVELLQQALGLGSLLLQMIAVLDGGSSSCCNDFHVEFRFYYSQS